MTANHPSSPDPNPSGKEKSAVDTHPPSDSTVGTFISAIDPSPTKKINFSEITITPENRPIVERLLIYRRATEDFTTFIQLMDPKFRIRQSTRKIIQFIQECRASGKSIGIISAPPRLGKSHLTTALAAFELLNRPDAKVVLASYGADLADQNSRRVQSFLNLDMWKAIAPNIALNPTESAFNKWSTTAGGSVRSVGVGGGLTGFGCTFAIVDDPHSNMEAADSPVQTKAVKEWFDSVLFTRREGKAPFILLVATRWSLQDLTSHVLTNYPDVSYLNLPAFNEHGEPLEKEFETLYKQQKESLPPRIWGSLYMGSPTPSEGALFTAADIEACCYSPDQLPDRRYMTFLAASDYALGGQDRTCHIVGGIDSEGILWIVDIYWKRNDSVEVWTQKQNEMSKIWRPKAWFEEGDATTKVLKGLRPRDQVYGGVDQYFKTISHGGKGKEFRAYPLSRLVSKREIRFPKNHPQWAELFNELIVFPAGNHDDFVDALALLINGYGKTATPKQAPPPANINNEVWKQQGAMIEQDGKIFINPRITAEMFDLENDLYSPRPSTRIG